MPDIQMQKEEMVRDQILKERETVLRAFIAEYKCLPSEIKVVEQWDDELKRLLWWVEKR